MAAADPQGASTDPANDSVLLDREDHVLTAAGMKTAVPAQPGADGNLVQTHQTNQQL